MPTFLETAKKIQPPFDLFVMDAGAPEPRKLMVVDAGIVSATMIDESDLAAQVCRVSGEITHWGILEAKARRAWQWAEVQYRQWRERLAVKMLTKPDGDKEWKKPTEGQIEAAYRSHPDYHGYQMRLQMYEESTNGAHAVLEGFRAKKEMLRSAVRRSGEDGAPQLSI